MEIKQPIILSQSLNQHRPIYISSHYYNITIDLHPYKLINKSILLVDLRV